MSELITVNNELDPAYARERQRVINEAQARRSREMGAVGLGERERSLQDDRAYQADVKAVERQMRDAARNRSGMFNPAV